MTSTRPLLTAALLTLAACTQAPIPGGGVLPDLAPSNFGTADYDYANGLARHRSGVFVVGETRGDLHAAPEGKYDAFIRKYDSSGAVLWGRQFGTPQYDYVEGVASDAADNAYLVGNTEGSLAGTRGGTDAFIRKYNTRGGVAWTRQFGSSEGDGLRAVAVGGDSVYVVGYTNGSLPGREGSGSAFIRKYTAGGGVVWTKQFGSVSTGAEDVAVDGSGNIYVVGYTNRASDMFIRKYSPGGSVTWNKVLHYSDYDRAEAVAVSGSSVYVVGTYLHDNNSENPDVRVVKFTTGGSKVFERSFGRVGGEMVFDASADGNSNLYLTGSTVTSLAGPYQGNYDGYVLKLSASGNRVWGTQVGTSDVDDARAVLARGGDVYVSGTTGGTLGGPNNGVYDAYLRRLNGTNGPTIWTDQ